jgi:PAS domain-containing protein
VPVRDQDLAQIVIETVGALVLVLDRDARIVRWNKRILASTAMQGGCGRRRWISTRGGHVLRDARFARSSG